MRTSLLRILVLLIWPLGLESASASPQASKVTDVSFFVRNVYPTLQSADCRECHNDNGVASTTELQFPPLDASPIEIARFGLSLKKLVDDDNVDRSLLLQKPTNQLEHTGGELIDPESAEAGLLRSWVLYLSSYAGDIQVPAEGLVRRPVPVVLRRLTHAQYNNTIRDLVGERTQPADSFPSEDFHHGFKNQAAGQSVSPLLVESWNRAAEKVARRAFLGGDRRGLLPDLPPSDADAEFREQFISTFGRRAFRRPLSPSEIRVYDQLFESEAAAGKRREAGAQAVMEAMLQSPNFLFHLEDGPDGGLQNYMIASRLSYFFWNTMPDEELFLAAEKGELASREAIERQARKMLSDERARRSLNEFLAQWLRFDRLFAAVRESYLFPEFGDELVLDMAEEVRRLFEHLVWQDRNFLEFFTADYAFVSSRLARLYGVAPPAKEFGMVRFPENLPRGGGVLGSALFLTLTSKPSDTSPTERGLFVREHFLGQEVPSPPPGVNATLPPNTTDHPLTNRRRLEIHLSDSSCAACHRLIDPIGLGLEQFDAIGRYRSKHPVTMVPTGTLVLEKMKRRVLELDLDLTASVRGIKNSEFSSPRQLGAVLAANTSCRRCVVKQLFRYAIGRLETAADQADIDAALRAFEASGFQFRELVIAIVSSTAFLGEIRE
jgi:hypothetical protein